MASMKSIIGVDVGGTLLRAARYDENLNQLERVEQPTLASRGRDVVLDRLYETIRQVLPERPEDLLGIGIALPGPLDVQAGVLIAPPNLPLRDIPIVELVEQNVGGPVFIGNDADLAGLAEFTRGAGLGTSTMIYMTLSTGIGGGVIVDGKLRIGRGQGGEVGHMVIVPDGPMCGCGRRGHVEAVASGTAIARIARERLQAGESSLVRDLVEGDLERVSAKVVAEAARAGDAMAREIFTQAGRYIGAHIASLMMLLNPDMFVLGGGLTKAGPLLFDPLHEAVREYAMHPRYYENTAIVRAQLGGEVGLVGAAAFVRQRLGL